MAVCLGLGELCVHQQPQPPLLWLNPKAHHLDRRSLGPRWGWEKWGSFVGLPETEAASSVLLTLGGGAAGDTGGRGKLQLLVCE